MRACCEKEIMELNKKSAYFSCYIPFGFSSKIPVTYHNGEKVMINGVEKQKKGERVVCFRS
jgi:hypothetical protein